MEQQLEDDCIATRTIKPIEAISLLAFCAPFPPPPTSSTNSSSSSDGSSISKTVRFGTVEVRQYPITIGDSPSVSVGIPLTIESDYLEEETQRLQVDAYERKRPNQQRRQGESLILDPSTRAQMLVSVGYTPKELVDAIHRLNIQRKMI